MRILVTGLDGFTGRHVEAELLEAGHTVVGLSSDLTDLPAIIAEVETVKPEAVIHLAGIAFVGHGNSNSIYDVNLIGTRNLLEALARNAPDVRSILLASSANVYGNHTEGVLSEDAATAPANNYAVSKLAMENMARLWLDRLPLFIVRPFNYTGVGQSNNFLIPKIVEHFIKRSPVIELGNIDIWREFGDVRAFAEIYRKLLEERPIGETLNVCTGQTYSLRDVVSYCEKITGHCIDVKINQDFVRTNDVRVLKGDNSRLKRVIGEWHIHDLEDTLKWMLKSKTTTAE